MSKGKTYTQIILSVEGIQAYLFSTGKLKEMIGGSEATASFPDRTLSFCTETLRLTKTEEPGEDDAWFVVLQNGAGALRLLLPNRGIAQEVLIDASAWVLESCPGLPLYGASVDCEWSENGFRDAYRKARQAIALKRATQPLPTRVVYPFCRIAPLDGLPAIKKDREEYISVESAGRRSQELLTQSREKFHEVEKIIRNAGGLRQLLSPDVGLKWAEDMDEMVAGNKVKRIALLHMDGNSLGKLFLDARDKVQNRNIPVREQNRHMLGLSNLVDNANRHAFAEALMSIIRKDTQDRNADSVYVVPARPLVLGGDELTIIVRADLAFLFADRYAAEFEKYTKEKYKRPLSVGGGMVVIPTGYPFTRAFKMVEELTENAKRMTSLLEPRPSSLDYLVVTNDIERDLESLRKKSYTACDGALLTGKPFICGRERQRNAGLNSLYDPKASLADILCDTELLHSILPSSQLRNAIDECREGVGAAKRAWKKLHENLLRGLGGGKENAIASFERIFAHENFYLQDDESNGPRVTLLGDYLELRRLFYPLEEDD